MNLSKYEQETTINYNNEEKSAVIFTYDKALMRKIDKRIAECQILNWCDEVKILHNTVYQRNGCELHFPDNTQMNRRQKWQNV